LSKTQFKKRLAQIESKTPTNKPSLILRIWCPNGQPQYSGGKIRIEALNAGEAKVE